MGLFSKKQKAYNEELEAPPAPLSLREIPDIPSELPSFKNDERPIRTEKIKFEPLEEFKLNTNETKKLFNEEKEELSRPLEVDKPIFVEVGRYKEMLSELQIAIKDSKKCEDILLRVGDYFNDEKKELNSFQNGIEDIQKKFIYVDKILFSRR